MGTCELRGKGREINTHPLKDQKVKGREIIQIDNTQITLYKKGERALRSTSSQSSKPCEVAQYPQHGVGTRTHTHMQTFSCSPPSTHTHINKHTNINTHTLTASPYKIRALYLSKRTNIAAAVSPQNLRCLRKRALNSQVRAHHQNAASP